MPNVQPVTDDLDIAPSPPRASGGDGYAAGGDIAALQADLARRLSGEGDQALAEAPVPPMERAVRFVSVAGGYCLLLAGYVAVASAAFR